MTEQDIPIGADLEEAVSVWYNNKSAGNMEKVFIVGEGFVKGVLSKINNPVSNVLTYDDLMQSGRIGLLLALKLYNPDSGASFRTWAYTRVRGSMLDQIRKFSYNSRTRSVEAVSYEKLDYSLYDNSSAEKEVGGLTPFEASVAIIDIIAGMSILKRSIVLMALNGLKSRHIARVIGVPLSVIDSERNEAVVELTENLSKSLERTIEGMLGSGTK